MIFNLYSENKFFRIFLQPTCAHREIGRVPDIIAHAPNPGVAGHGVAKGAFSQERFAVIDFKQAAEEVRVFLPDPRELQLWSREFFDGLAVRLGDG